MRVFRYQSLMEKLQIVDQKTGEPTGAHMDRAQAIACGAWCRSTNVFVLDHSGNVLCHRRSSLKERHPGAWSTHLGGHVTEGESFLMNAAKELEEESGIRVDPSALLPWRTTKMEGARLWVREFVAMVDSERLTLVPQPGEVDEFRWLAPSEIVRRADAGEEWLIGTHDFRTEYFCMRAVLTAAHAFGAVRIPDPLRAWHPETIGT
jgi:isopentenyldiphosphate isomerase